MAGRSEAGRAAALATILVTFIGAAGNAQVEEEVEGGGAIDLDALETETTGGDAAGGEASGGDAALPTEPAPARVETPRPPPEPTWDPDPITYTLDNGLRVVLAPTPGRRFAALVVRYRVGTSDAPAGYPSLAHVTEHAMFTGTDRIGDHEIALRMDASGAVTSNGYTHGTFTDYVTSLPVSEVPTALFVEAHRLARTASGLDAARLRRARSAVHNEASLYGWALGWRRATLGALLGPDAGHEPRTYRDDDVDAIRVEHVQWFLQRHYAPDLATVALVGGFEVDRARADIERAFGGVVRTGSAPEELPRAPWRPLASRSRARIASHDGRSHVTLAWRAPDLGSEDEAAFDVWLTRLFDPRTGALAPLIDDGVAERIQLESTRRDARSYVVIRITAGRRRDVAELLMRIDRTIAEAAIAPRAIEGSLELAQRRLLAETRAEDEDLEARATWLAASRDGYVPSLRERYERYRAVDAPALARALRWLAPESRATILERPRRAAAR